MTAQALLIILLAQVALVAGQVSLKHAMNLRNQSASATRRSAGYLALGVALLALWFFMWMGLLQRLDLSRVFPFEGISPVLLVLAACLLLHEKTTWRVWMGAGLIGLGTMLVGLS